MSNPRRGESVHPLIDNRLPCNILANCDSLIDIVIIIKRAVVGKRVEDYPVGTYLKLIRSTALASPLDDREEIRRKIDQKGAERYSQPGLVTVVPIETMLKVLQEPQALGKQGELRIYILAIAICLKSSPLYGLIFAVDESTLEQVFDKL